MESSTQSRKPFERLKQPPARSQERRTHTARTPTSQFLQLTSVNEVPTQLMMSDQIIAYDVGEASSSDLLAEPQKYLVERLRRDGARRACATWSIP